MVCPHSDICARVPFGAALAHYNIAANHAFAAKFLDAEAAALGIAAVAG